jgi:5-hydroxyisourate hydrolase
MATVSSHTLSSVDGTHAGGIGVALHRLDPSGARVTLFETATDEGGRLSETVALTPGDADARFELVFQTGDYFAAQPIPVTGMQIIREVVIRLAMPDPDARYHIPLMLAPNSYSVWWSS